MCMYIDDLMTEMQDVSPQINQNKLNVCMQICILYIKSMEMELVIVE